MRRVSGLLLVAALSALSFASPAAASPAGDPEKARKKLEKDDQKFTPDGFFRAIDHGDKKSVALYLEAGMDPNTKGNWDTSALTKAAESNQPDVAQLLIGAGADLNARNRDGRSPAYMAVNSGSVDRGAKVLDVLVKAGADLKTPYRNGRTLLHLAVDSDNGAALTKLLAAGLDPNAKDENGATPFSEAASLGRKVTLPLLLRAPGVDLNVRDGDGETPLMKAAHTGELDAAKALMAAGADAKAVTKDGASALHFTCTLPNASRKSMKIPDGNFLGIAELLIAAGVPVDGKKKGDGATPLLMAAQDGFAPMVTALLARGASPNVKDTPDQMTPLLYAARDGNADVLKLLIDAKADVNARDRVGRNALKLGQDYPEVVAMLKAAGATAGAAPSGAPAKKGKK